jgi:hypothetical protein
MKLRPLSNALSAWRPADAPSTANPVSTIASEWAHIVGERVAQHSSPLSLTDGTLLVGTRSSAWSQQLEFLAPEILASIGALVPGDTVTRLRFRNGAFRRTRPAQIDPVAVAQRIASGPVPMPALDERDALQRVRKRVAETRRRARTSCGRCGAPTESEALCAPCAGSGERARRVELERLCFAAPWLSSDEIAAVVPGASEADIQDVRRNLMQRWWVTLERARRLRRALSRRERQIASSYVLLQSGLAPENITPAVVRNLLGDELEAQLSGEPLPKHE